MNTPLLHAELARRRANVNVRVIDDIRNAYRIDDPFNTIDCDPETCYDNFEHLMKGDSLVYAEIANSTPNDGKHVKTGFDKMVTMSARTSCVFGRSDIRRMRKCVVGTGIYYNHWMYTPHGAVVDASVLEDVCNGEDYSILCCLIWVDSELMNARSDNSTGLFYMSFGLDISQETCTVCGKTTYRGESPCKHVVTRGGLGVLPAFSICKFNRFDRIAMEREE